MSKCRTCSGYLDKKKEEYVKFGNKLWHKDCFWNDDKAIKYGIYYFCKSIFGDTYNEYKVKSQLRAFIKQGMTYKGILRTLQYWFLIKKSNPKKANGGIGIVGYVYTDALEYFQRIEKGKEAAAKADIDSIVNPSVKTVVFRSKTPSLPKNIQIYDL